VGWQYRLIPRCRGSDHDAYSPAHNASTNWSQSTNKYSRSHYYFKWISSSACWHRWTNRIRRTVAVRSCNARFCGQNQRRSCSYALRSQCHRIESLAQRLGSGGSLRCGFRYFHKNSTVSGTPLEAIRADGSQVAVVTSSGDIALLNEQLQHVGTVGGMKFPGNPVYSRDGRFLYIPSDKSIIRTAPTFTIIDTKTFTNTGQIPDVFLTDDPPTFYGVIDVCDSTPGGTTLRASEESGLLIGPSPRGLSSSTLASHALSRLRQFSLISLVRVLRFRPKRPRMITLRSF